MDPRSGTVVLRPLVLADEDQVMRAQDELAEDDFSFVFIEPGESWGEYVARLERQRQGLDVAPGFVPSTFLLAEVGDDIVGRVSIRHELNDQLRLVGGHIGYGVRPGFRRRGYATQILRRSLEVARDLGIERVLITCDDDNPGSIRVIESCGGVLEDVVAPDGMPLVRRYWIDRSSTG